MSAATNEISEIMPLSRDNVAKLIASREKSRRLSHANEPCRRELVRWPFPGAAELWVRDADGVEQHSLATCFNLSLGGVGVRLDEPLEVGAEISIAVHQPEVSFHGRAIVRHCTPDAGGEHVAGLAFVFTQRKAKRPGSVTPSRDRKTNSS